MKQFRFSEKVIPKRGKFTILGGLQAKYEKVLEQLEMKKVEVEEVKEEVRKCRQQIIQAEQERRNNEAAIKNLQV